MELLVALAVADRVIKVGVVDLDAALGLALLSHPPLKPLQPPVAGALE